MTVKQYNLSNDYFSDILAYKIGRIAVIRKGEEVGLQDIEAKTNWDTLVTLPDELSPLSTKYFIIWSNNCNYNAEITVSESSIRYYLRNGTIPQSTRLVFTLIYVTAS